MRAELRAAEKIAATGDGPASGSLDVHLIGTNLHYEWCICSDVNAFHDGELSPERALAVREHLPDCSSCQATLHTAMQLAMSAADEVARRSATAAAEPSPDTLGQPPRSWPPGTGDAAAAATERTAAHRELDAMEYAVTRDAYEAERAAEPDLRDEEPWAPEPVSDITIPAPEPRPDVTVETDHLDGVDQVDPERAAGAELVEHRDLHSDATAIGIEPLPPLTCTAPGCGVTLAADFVGSGWAMVAGRWLCDVHSPIEYPFGAGES